MLSADFKTARILIVDDELPNVRLLERLLQREGYTNFHSTTDPRMVPAMFVSSRPDLLLLDLNMPHVDGFGVMEQLQLLTTNGSYSPILVLTADITTETKQKALSSGASDFLSKPFDHTEVLLRIRNLLETRLLYLRLQNQNSLLEDTVRERTQELKETHYEILARLARAAEFRDDDTGQHTQRVATSAKLLARQLELPELQIDLIHRAAPLHDVGKIGISDTILLKPGKLTDDEFAIMKSHAAIGAELLGGGRSDLVQMAERIAASHHERWDGRGYPQQLSGEQIPLEGRILAVADVFDALTHERPYKSAWSVPDTVDEITRQSAQQFDPRVVEAFLSLSHEELV